MYFIFSNKGQDVEIVQDFKECLLRRLKVREMVQFLQFLLGLIMQNIKTYSGLIVLQSLLTKWREWLQKMAPFLDAVATR